MTPLTADELQEVFDEMQIGKVVINMQDKPQKPIEEQQEEADQAVKAVEKKEQK